MSNNEFITYFLNERKLQYDDLLVQELVLKWFKLAVQWIEQKVDFLYMYAYKEFALPQGEFSIDLPPLTKRIIHVIDKKRKLKLVEGSFDIEEAIVCGPAIPTRIRATDLKLYFNRKAKEDIDYVMSYYRYTYEDQQFMEPTSTHPLIQNYPKLVFYVMAFYVDDYYRDEKQARFDLAMAEELLKKARSNERSKTGAIGQLSIRL